MSDVALRFGASDDGLTAQFRKVDRQLDQFQAQTNKVASAIGKGFGNLGAIIGGLTFGALIRESVQLADSLEKASAQTGIVVEALQRLQFIAAQSSVSFESVSGAVNRLQKALVESGEGSAEATAALGRLGLSVNDIISLSPDEQFLRIAQSISAIENPAEQTAAAMALFGRSGAELLPILKEGGDGVAALSAKFDTLGITLSGETTKSVDDLGDAFDLTGDSVKKLGVELLSIVSPAITAGLEGLTLTLKSFRFALVGGDNEIVRISDQIDKLRGQAVAFQNALNPEGKRRFGKLSAEIAELQLQLDKLTGTGASGFVALEKIAVDLANIRAPDIKFPAVAGPVEPTPAELRLRDTDTSPFNQLKLEQYELVEVANQAHLDELIRQQEQFANRRFEVDNGLQGLLAQSREQFGLQEINFEEIKAASIYDIAGGLFSALASQNEAFAKVQQGIAVAQTIWFTSGAVMRALRDVPYPANIGVAAKIAAAGAIQIAKIKSTSFKGGGGAASGGIAIGGAGSSQATLPETPAAATGANAKAGTTIYISGLISRAIVDDLVDKLRDEVNRDVTIFSANSRQAMDLYPT